MPTKSPQEAASKWRARTAAAATDYAKGVMAVTVNPAQAAANQADKWLANIQEAAANDRFRKGLARVTLQDWQAKASQKGAQRIAAGVQGAESRMTQFFTGFLPALEGVTAQTRAMPSTTLADRKQRMLAQVDGVAALKGRF